jgi:hypothetical protein
VEVAQAEKGMIYLVVILMYLAFGPLALAPMAGEMMEGQQ